MKDRNVVETVWWSLRRFISSFYHLLSIIFLTPTRLISPVLLIQTLIFAATVQTIHILPALLAREVEALCDMCNVLHARKSSWRGIWNVITEPSTLKLKDISVIYVDVCSLWNSTLGIMKRNVDLECFENMLNYFRFMLGFIISLLIFIIWRIHDDINLLDWKLIGF